MEPKQKHVILFGLGHGCRDKGVGFQFSTLEFACLMFGQKLKNILPNKWFDGDFTLVKGTTKSPTQEVQEHCFLLKSTKSTFQIFP